MTEIARIITAEPVINGVLKIEWDDHHEGVADLRPVIARGKIFAYLQDPDNFREVQLGEYGHPIYWGNERGEQIDFGGDFPAAASRTTGRDSTECGLRLGAAGVGVVIYCACRARASARSSSCLGAPSSWRGTA